MSEKQRVESVEIPEEIANHIRSQAWFELYDDLNEFVREAVWNRILRKES